jgi:hypothetical protein
MLGSSMFTAYPLGPAYLRDQDNDSRDGGEDRLYAGAPKSRLGGFMGARVEMLLFYSRGTIVLTLTRHVGAELQSQAKTRQGKWYLLDLACGTGGCLASGPDSIVRSLNARSSAFKHRYLI